MIPKKTENMLTGVFTFVGGIAALVFAYQFRAAGTAFSAAFVVASALMLVGFFLWTRRRKTRQ